MYVKRNLERKIEKYIKSPEIIAIVGARQSGKTTLLRKIYSRYKKNSVFLSFEEPEVLSIFEKSTSDFINLYVKGKKFLFIDEFQYTKNGGKILKQIYDNHKIKIFITGSSSIDLTVKALKYLVGRIFIFELYPFDFEEFLRAKNEDYAKLYTNYARIDLTKVKDMVNLNFKEEVASILRRYFEEYLVYGGYPRVVLAQDIEEKKEVLKNIYTTYFLREVKDYLGLVDDYKLHQLIKALSFQIGRIIEYKELSSISGYSFSSLKKYLNFLEKTYICFLLKPFFKNKRKEIVKNPKIYFLDTGLRNSVVRDFRRLKERPDSGALLENAVFMQLKKQGLELKYWRDKQRRELDFVIDEPALKIGFEVKLSIERCKVNPSIRRFINVYSDFFIVFLYEQGFDLAARDNSFIKFPCFVL